MTRPPGVALVVLLVTAASLVGWRLGNDHRVAARLVVVESVLDGDTIVVRESGPVGVRGSVPEGRRSTVRLLGVDTPETHHPDKPVQCFGPEASAYTERQLLGRTVRLEYDVERRDRYGRELAHVIIDGTRFGDTLLRLGFARLLVIPPNGIHARTMLAEELDAKRHGRGLWSAC